MLTIIISVCYLYLIPSVSWISERFHPLLKILWGVCIIDCIRDIVVADSYYNYKIVYDPLYMFKSLLSTFTLGLTRGFFLLVVGPALHISEARYLREAVNNRQPVTPYCPRSSRAREYYYDRELEKILQSGVLVSNEKTLHQELSLCKSQLANLYPKKLFEKIAERVGGDHQEMKKRRAYAEKGIRDLAASRIYIHRDVIDQLPDAVIRAMKDKPPYSVSDIVRFKELAPFFGGNCSWSILFVIQALIPLVANGLFEDMNLNDNDPLDNHIYHYARSTATMHSVEASDDPRFADPALCD